MKLRAFFLAGIFPFFGEASAQESPSHSWRALIIYTNSIDSIYGGSGANIYSDYLDGVFEGINDAYRHSEIDARAQIAGVVWDKTYSLMYSDAYDPGCGNRNDLIYGTNGMGRYVNLMGKYSADILVMIHKNRPGGCAHFLSTAVSRGHGSFWVRDPVDVHNWAHEMGHIQNVTHCGGGASYYAGCFGRANRRASSRYDVLYSG